MYNIIEFKDKNGKSTEYLATEKGVGYFNKEYNPTMWKEGIPSMMLAIDIAAVLNNDLKK